MTDLHWPALPLEAWRETADTLHLWTQIVGKVRLACAPRLNHWWHCTLYVNTRGLTTLAMPHGVETFEIQLDFIQQRLEIKTSRDRSTHFPLEPQSVATFYERLMSALASLRINVAINTKPQELSDPIPFELDHQHAAYDAESAQRFWRALLAMDPIFQEFRGRFLGKSSPVHFFWGSFDLACTRFSGRRASPRPGVITSEAYSHECISGGFWPGQGLGFPAFYSYTAPQPEGLEKDPDATRYWNADFSQFILPYQDVASAADPRAVLLDFLQKTYAAGARCAGWDRAALESPRP